ncbi:MULTISPECIES: threonine synthase [unclassified Minwuia]|uniref:threonine synthase n=1 Tax=unclassified Minwuia TaxID=2618799 RepID=UPI002478ED36|nr:MULTISPECIES: threonine synthase [unclassified Minwuia]
MRYVSTRGVAPVLEFDDVLLTGLARDGGLYVPESLPQLDLAGLQGLSYADLAARVLGPLTGDSIGQDEFRQMMADTYAAFDHTAVAPLKQIGANDWVMELFHGPTLAFKDFALQALGRFFDRVLSDRGERVTILGATSGDTGSAAIEGCRGREAVDIFILYPLGRVSDVQRRQMTTVEDANVHAIAIEGDFDDCQALVKAAFNDLRFRDSMRLSAVNSINWARVAAQVVYYVHAGIALGGRPLAFSVPSGNFGNIFAGEIARRMGLPVDTLLIATNVNDILTRFFDTGEYRTRGVSATMSPSMDIQVSSNFERLLFDMVDRDGPRVQGLMDNLKQSGGFTAPAAAFEAAQKVFTARRVDEDETLEEMRRVWRDTGEILDPHSAIGTAAARRARAEGRIADAVPTVSLATAHPAKFPDAVQQAIGVHPALPERLADLHERKERSITLPNDLGALQRHLESYARIAGGGAN